MNKFFYYFTSPLLFLCTFLYFPTSSTVCNFLGFVRLSGNVQKTKLNQKRKREELVKVWREIIYLIKKNIVTKRIGKI